MVDIKILKEKVNNEVDSQRERLTEIAKWMYENPELGSEEYKAYTLLTEELEKQGAKVEKQLLGIPTAFSASWKGKKKGPKVAVLAEYDALPGVCHGCGHNLIAASAIGSGVAAARVAQVLRARESDKRERCSLTCKLPSPNAQCKLTHIGTKQAEELPRPDNGKKSHACQANKPTALGH